MNDDLEFISEIEERFFQNRSLDILDVVSQNRQSIERVCLGIEILFQLRDYDFDWLNEQLRRTDLNLSQLDIDLIVSSVFATAIEFRRSFLGSKLFHIASGNSAVALKGPNDSVAIGEKIDNITLLDRIAAGGIVTTYRGFADNQLSYAIRVPNAVPDASREIVWERLREEFGVLEVFAQQGVEGTARQVKWLETPLGPVSIAEFVEGKVLAEVPKVSLTQEAVVRIIQMVSTTLGRIHELGFIHGDVKPENIIVTPGGKAILLDLNTVLPTDILEIQLDRFSGTLSYMSIESLAGGSSEVSIQRDIHAIGALLYELLEDRQFTEGSCKEDIFVAQTVNLHSIQDRFTEKTPLALRSVVEFATNLDPELRFDNCAALNHALIQSQENPDVEVTIYREPISVAFRLGMGISEILYAIGNSIPLVAELEEKGSAARLNNEQQNRLLGAVAISEDSRVVVKLAGEMDIELPEIDRDGYFLRLPMTWATRQPKTFDEFRSKLESSLDLTKQMQDLVQSKLLDSRQASAFRLGSLISGDFGKSQLKEIEVEFQGKLSQSVLKKIDLIIDKTTKASRRKRLQAIANFLKPSLSQTLLG